MSRQVAIEESFVLKDFSMAQFFVKEIVDLI